MSSRNVLVCDQRSIRARVSGRFSFLFFILHLRSLWFGVRSPSLALCATHRHHHHSIGVLPSWHGPLKFITFLARLSRGGIRATCFSFCALAHAEPAGPEGGNKAVCDLTGREALSARTENICLMDGPRDVDAGAVRAFYECELLLRVLRVGHCTVEHILSAVVRLRAGQ